jgi:hypothetical protein
VSWLRRVVATAEKLSLGLPTLVAALAVSVKGLSGLVERSLIPGAIGALIITSLVYWLGLRRDQSADPAGESENLAPARVTDRSAVIAWLVQGTAALFVVRAMGFTWVPRIGSSDFGGHAGMVMWIAENGGLPTSTKWPVGMSNYPPGSHVFPALLAWITGRSPLEMLWLVAMLGAIAQWPLLVLLTRSVSKRHSWWVGLSVLVFVFGTFRFTFGMISADFFFAQMIGQWMALASVTWSVLALKNRKPFAQWLPGMIVCALGSFVAYPQGSVVALGAAAVGLAALPMTRRTRIMVFGVPLALGLAGLFALSKTVYWSSQLLAGGPGATIKPSVKVLGGPVLLTLAAAGLLLLLSRLRHDRFVAPVVGAILGPLLVIGAMVSLQNGFPVLLEVADYRVIKNVFPLVPYGAIAAAIAVEHAGLWLLSGFQGSQRLAVGSVLTTLVGAVVLVSLFVVDPVRSSPRPIYDRHAYELGRTLPQQVRHTDLGLAGPWVEVSVMRWVGIGPLVTDSRPVEFPRSNQWKQWPDSSVKEDYLLVSGPFVDVYAKLPGVTVVRRNGAAVLLKRRPRS